MSAPEESAPTPPAPGAGEGTGGPQRITIDEFARVEMKVGRVTAAEPHPQADRLLVLKVDVGEAEPRQLVAGIRADWSPEEITGRSVVVVTNLKPARLRGVESQGMLLAVRGEERILPLAVDGEAAPGTRVT